MSNEFALATVSETVARIIRETLGAGMTVRVGPPIATAKDEVAVYPYALIRDAEWAGHDLPTRTSEGRQVKRPTAAVRMRYLLAFDGKGDELKAQVAMAKVLRRFHELPVINSKAIKEATTNSQQIKGNDLADQPDPVRMTLLSPTTDDISRIWGLFPQVRHRPSLHYEAGIILVEAKDRRVTAIPVKERGLEVIPLRRPRLETVKARLDAAGSEPSSTLPLIQGRILVAEGIDLDAEKVAVRWDGKSLPAAAAKVSSERLEIKLVPASVPADLLRAGTHVLEVVHQVDMGKPPSPRPVTSSNLLPFVLHPILESLAPNPPGTRMIEVKIKPDVTATQDVALVLNPKQEGGEGFRATAPKDNDVVAPNTSTGKVTFDTTGATAGTYMARLEVDGVSSSWKIDQATGELHLDEVVLT